MAYSTLRAEMARKNVKQKSLAGLLGLSQNYFNQKMNGKRPFRLDEAKTIAEAMGSSIDYLFGDDVPELSSPADQTA